MRIIILVLAVTLLVTGASEASWYVVNAKKQVIVKCEYQPDSKDLQSRKETVVFSKEDIALSEAEYRDGKITRRVKTSSEIAEESKRKEKEADEDLIDAKIRAMAIEKLKSEGVVLKSQENK